MTLCLRTRADAFGMCVCLQSSLTERRCVCVCVKEEMCWRVRGDDIVFACVRADMFACVSVCSQVKRRCVCV